MNLSPDQIQAIIKILENLFEMAKAHFLGTYYTGPNIYFEIAQKQNPLDTIDGIFQYALKNTFANSTIDNNLVQSLAEISANYIEAEKNRAFERIIDGVKTAKSPDEIPQIIENTINRSNNYIDMLVNTETRNVQAHAEISGIQQLGASLGIDDPTVVRLGVWDNKICDACLKLWHSPQNIKIPRAWKLSQLKQGYNTDRFNPVPTISPTHPRCRHILTIVPPNYGYGNDGWPKYMGWGYDMYNDQNGIEKNERDYTDFGTTCDIFQFISNHDNCDCDHHPTTRT